MSLNDIEWSTSSGKLLNFHDSLSCCPNKDLKEIATLVQQQLPTGRLTAMPTGYELAQVHFELAKDEE